MLINIFIDSSLWAATELFQQWLAVDVKAWFPLGDTFFKVEINTTATFIPRR